jgi:hypothetical protein
MAQKTFVNNAAATKQQYALTMTGTFVAGETITITMNSKTLVVTIGTLVTLTQVATTVKEAWQSSTFTDTTASCLPQGGGTSVGEMSTMTATSSAGVVTILGDTAGVPHTISSASDTSASGTATLTTIVTASGPKFADNVLNWLDGSLPVDGDDIIINGPFQVLYGFAAFSGVQPASITIGDRCGATTQIGLPFVNAAGYNEYRTPEWSIGPVLLNVRGAAGLVKINAGTDPMNVNVYSSGTSLELGYSPIQVRTNEAAASCVVSAYGGNVSVAARGETAKVLTARQSGAGRLTIGNAVTFTNLSGNITLVAD